MAVFSQHEVDEQALDYTWLRDGGIVLFKSLDFLRDDEGCLTSKGYLHRTIDCATWTSEAAMHESLASTLSFPAYYGRNLNALNDSLSEDLDIPLESGMVLTLLRADRVSQPLLSAVLSIGAHAIRRHMLRGKRFLLFVQTVDGQAQYSGLGCASATWNRREWLTASRL